MVYRRDSEGVITQYNRSSTENLFDFEIIDLTITASADLDKEIHKITTNIQKSMNLSEGPLVKLALFKTKEGDHLLITIHHLVVDGVSWRIILEDFGIGYKQLSNGKKLSFQLKTNSFKLWSEKLIEYSKNKNLLKELPYWNKVESKQILQLSKDFDHNEENRGEHHSAELLLKKEYTDKLLKEVHRAYNTEINDILLSALYLSLKEWSGLDQFLINLEGHGREEIIENVDISRTVGWFTSQFPLILDLADEEKLPEVIKGVKDRLREIPDKGQGYGILRYLTEPERKKGVDFQSHPEISFNYLGEFGKDITIQNLFSLSEKSTGESMSSELLNFYSLNINCMVKEGVLNLTIGYNSTEYKASNIEKFTEILKQNIEKIINHCLEQETNNIVAVKYTRKPDNSQDENIVLLKAGRKDKNIFFIHDRTGEIDGYIEMANLIENDYTLWGIKADRYEKLFPANRDIKELAEYYLEKIRTIQKIGPFNLVGWSFGGIVSYEIARILEQTGESIDLLFIIDSPHFEKKNRVNFTLETEKSFIKKHLGLTIPDYFKDGESLWQICVDFLEKDYTAIERLKKQLPKTAEIAIPSFDNIDSAKLIQFINTYRSYILAIDNYFPESKIKQKICYLKATKDSNINYDLWNSYTEGYVHFHEVDCDHLSVLKMPHLSKLLEFFYKHL